MQAVKCHLPYRADSVPEKKAGTLAPANREIQHYHSKHLLTRLSGTGILIGSPSNLIAFDTPEHGIRQLLLVFSRA